MNPSVDLILSRADDNGPMTRCRILATAEQSFREIGYQKTTVADIAKTLRMSPANVYRFFDSKKAINEAVVGRVTQEVEARISAIANGPGLTSVERVADIIRTLHLDCVERCRLNPRIHEMVEAAMTESWDVCRNHVDRLLGVLVRVVSDGVRDGEFAVSDPATAAECIFAAITRYNHPIFVTQYPNLPAPPALETMIAFLLRGLSADARR